MGSPDVCLTSAASLRELREGQLTPRFACSSTQEAPTAREKPAASRVGWPIPVVQTTQQPRQPGLPHPLHLLSRELAATAFPEAGRSASWTPAPNAWGTPETDSLRNLPERGKRPSRRSPSFPLLLLRGTMWGSGTCGNRTLGSFSILTLLISFLEISLPTLVQPSPKRLTHLLT